MEYKNDRQNFKWRPNDESITTRTRYDLEADHWYRSFKSAEMKYGSSSTTKDFEVIEMVFNLVFALLFLLVIILVDLVKRLCR